MRGSAISTLLAAAIFAAAVISATAGGPANQPVPAPGNHNETLVLGTGTKKMTRTKNRLPEKWVGKPSDSLNATDVIWEFFKAHPRMPLTSPIAKNH